MKYFLLTLLLLTLLPIFTTQQTCKSFFIDETETTSNVACPITFINNGDGCKPFQTIYQNVTSNSCNQNSDCKFSYLKCLSNKCLSVDRLEGDSCTHDEQCVTTKDSAKKGGLYCKDNRCKILKMKYTKKIDEKCGDINNSTGVYNACAFGASCVLGNCLKTPMVGKGENCTQVFNPFKEYRVCQASFYCGSDAVCVNSLRMESKCNETIACQTGYSCRKSKDASNAICQRFADFEEYCKEDIDCGNTNSGMVKCMDNKCKRLLSGLKGVSCTNHTECYSGYCDQDTKKCSGVTIDNGKTCYNSTSCNSNSGGCVCGGKANNGKTEGKCLPSCVGPLYDVISCLFNKGLYIGAEVANSVTPGYEYSQYANEDSGIYRACKTYYARYYTCLHRVWKNVGQSSTINEINGLKISTETSFDNIEVVLPRRSDANLLLSPYNLLLFVFIVMALLC